MKINPIKINRFKFWLGVWERHHMKYRGAKKLTFALMLIYRLVFFGGIAIYLEIRLSKDTEKHDPE